MYSYTVYLFAEKYIPIAKTLEYKEELPNGTKVNQKKLANEVILAALVCLQEKGFIELSLKESKILFIKKVDAIVKKLKENDGSLESIEAKILQSAHTERKVSDITRDLIDYSYNPWEDVVNIVKGSLLQKGILQKEEKGKILFIKTYKAGLTGELPQEEVSKQDGYESAVNNFKQTEQLYEKVISGINSGISAKVQSDSTSSSFD